MQENMPQQPSAVFLEELAHLKNQFIRSFSPLTDGNARNSILSLNKFYQKIIAYQKTLTDQSTENSQLQALLEFCADHYLLAYVKVTEKNNFLTTTTLDIFCYKTVLETEIIHLQTAITLVEQLEKASEDTVLQWKEKLPTMKRDLLYRILYASYLFRRSLEEEDEKNSQKYQAHCNLIKKYSSCYKNYTLLDYNDYLKEANLFTAREGKSAITDGQEKNYTTATNLLMGEGLILVNKLPTANSTPTNITKAPYAFLYIICKNKFYYYDKQNNTLHTISTDSALISSLNKTHLQGKSHVPVSDDIETYIKKKFNYTAPRPSTRILSIQNHILAWEANTTLNNLLSDYNYNNDEQIDKDDLKKIVVLLSGLNVHLEILLTINSPLEKLAPLNFELLKNAIDLYYLFISENIPSTSLKTINQNECLTNFFALTLTFFEQCQPDKLFEEFAQFYQLDKSFIQQEETEFTDFYQKKSLPAEKIQAAKEKLIKKLTPTTKQFQPSSSSYPLMGPTNTIPQSGPLDLTQPKTSSSSPLNTLLEPLKKMLEQPLVEFTQFEKTNKELLGIFAELSRQNNDPIVNYSSQITMLLKHVVTYLFYAVGAFLKKKDIPLYLTLTLMKSVVNYIADNKHPLIDEAENKPYLIDFFAYCLVLLNTAGPRSDSTMTINPEEPILLRLKLIQITTEFEIFYATTERKNEMQKPFQTNAPKKELPINLMPSQIPFPATKPNVPYLFQAPLTATIPAIIVENPLKNTAADIPPTQRKIVSVQRKKTIFQSSSTTPSPQQQALQPNALTTPELAQSPTPQILSASPSMLKPLDKRSSPAVQPTNLPHHLIYKYPAQFDRKTDGTLASFWIYPIVPGNTPPFYYSINAIDDNNETALMVAIRRGEAETVEILLNNGANPKCYDNNGYLPIHHLPTVYLENKETFCQKNFISTLNVLSKAKVKIDSRTTQGETLLHIAIKELCTLLTKEIRLNTNTTLNTTIGFNNYLIFVQKLMENGAVLYTTDNNGQTPLDILNETFTQLQAGDKKNIPQIKQIKDIILSRNYVRFTKNNWEISLPGDSLSGNLTCSLKNLQSQDINFFKNTFQTWIKNNSLKADQKKYLLAQMANLVHDQLYHLKNTNAQLSPSKKTPNTQKAVLEDFLTFLENQRLTETLQDLCIKKVLSYNSKNIPPLLHNSFKELFYKNNMINRIFYLHVKKNNIDVGENPHSQKTDSEKRHPRKRNK